MVEPAAAPKHEGKGEAPPLEPLPKQFGKYTLMRRLAAGGMAEIFLALHRSVAGFEKLIVIKRILPSMNTNKAFIDMLLHEARVAATLSHPNIVQTFDVGQVDGTYFIAMEHIHGEDIQAIVRAMRKKELSEFPLEHTLGIILAMCSGLAYAHEKRDLDGRPLTIVHRDISPRNIVVSFTGDVKIVDFGIAKSGVEPGDDTGTGQLKGKAPYMSPEQASGQEIDWRSDIFATGVMLFELTTGKRLFKGASEFETLKLIVDKEYPKPSDIRPGYPAELERIVMRSLAKDRDDRYQTAREMQGDIEAFVRHERIAVSGVSLTTWMQFLFEDKIAQQKEALQDIKQLADVIAAQHGSMYEGATSTNTTMPAATAPSLPPPPKRNNAAPIAAVAITIALVAGGIFYVKHEDGLRDAEAKQAAVPLPGPETAGVAAPQAKGAVEITSTPTGCAVWVDGDLRPEVTPARVDKLPLGKEIKIKLTKDGFEAYRTEVTLTDAAPNKKLAAEMKTGSVTVVLKIDPPPTIWLDGQPWKGDRTKVDGLSAGEDHKIVASANGYQPHTYTINAKQGETKTIVDQLIKADAASAAGAGQQEKPAPVAGAPGKVRVGAKGGFCNVTVNGTSYGPTPVEAVVPAGTARVSCKPANGPSMSQTVNVASGDTARVSFKIEE